jgi:hypothetical protein
MQKINLILPKVGVEIDFNLEGNRLYFLGGPIQGGGHWQTMAIKMLAELDPGCYVACPHGYNTDHWLFKSYVQLVCENSKNILEFPNQTLWERYFLPRASYYGSIIMWLPCEDETDPRIDGNPYAQDTYGELGSWRVKAANPHVFSFEKGKMRRHFHRVNLVIGAEPNFPGLKTIQKNFDDEFGRQYLIYSSLKETIENAVALAKKNIPNTKIFQTTKT